MAAHNAPLPRNPRDRNPAFGGARWLVLGTLTACLLVRPLEAQDPYKTGRDFQRALANPCGILWSGDNALRQSLIDLARREQVAIFLDRRVDPGQPIRFGSQPAPLRQVLEKLASQLNLQVSTVGDVVYLGPAPTSGKLATLVELKSHESSQLPPALARKLARRSPWRWSQLSQPRKLAEALAESYQLRIANPELIPHDLWPEVQLPALNFVEKMTLLLAGFDLTLQIDAASATVRLTPISAAVHVERSYSARSFEKHASEIRRRFPDIPIRQTEGRYVVAACIEQHTTIRQLIAGTSPATPPDAPRTVFTLKLVNQPVGAVLNAIKQQTALNVTIGPQVGDRLKTPVSFEIKDQPLEVLLQKTLQPAGLTYRLSEGTLEVKVRD